MQINLNSYVEYQIDGQGYQQALAFYAQNLGLGASNTPLAEDTDNDRFGDGTVLTNTLQSFIVPIHETGTTLDLRIRVSANSANEEIAFDFLELIEGSALPGSIASFTGTIVQDQVALQWQTSVESENEGFEVQRSADGRVWSTLAFIRGAGNSNVLERYSYEDHRPLIGINYYRLKQIDFSGVFAFSRMVRVDYRAEDHSPKIFPNPAQGYFTLHFTDTHQQPVSVIIFNQMGETVAKRNLPTNTSNAHFELEMAGTYLVQLSVGNKTAYYKVINIL